jgi:hypothetical protein
MNKRMLAASLVAVALLSARAGIARADGDKEENEQKIDFKNVPKAVRKTLKREAGDVKIKTVDKEKLKGKTVFEADVKIDDHNYEIVVSEDGLLLSKKLDEEEDENKSADKKEAKVKSKDEDKEEHEDKGK